MIVIKVELHSAVTHQITELARTVIYNNGGTGTLGDYKTFACRGRDAEALQKNMVAVLQGATPIHSGEVLKHQRLTEHVLNLVAKSLTAMGYGK